MGAKKINRFYITTITTLLLVFSVCIFAGATEIQHDATAADFKVSPAFGDGMVFQQNEPIKIWGTSSSEGEYVKAVFDGSIGSSVVKDGKWEIELAPRSYSSDPKVLEVIGGEGSDYITFENITIGDVWWVMGQSNAEMTCSTDSSWEEFEASLTGDENITLYALKENSFTETTHTRWRKLNKYSSYDTSAVACYTAKEISKLTGNEVPLAMVTMAYGGHELSSFLPPELSKKHSSTGEKSLIYNDVISYIINMPVKGIIWYQGEADASIYHDYVKKFSDYINWLREKKAQDNYDFPVYCVELSPCFDDPNDPQRQFIDFGSVRGEQGNLPSLIKNFNICVSSDLWSSKEYSNNLHPNNKMYVSRRLSLMILSKEYGFGGEACYFGPVLKKAELSDDKREAVITFDYCADGLSAEKFDGFLVIGNKWNKIENVQYEIVSPDKVKISASEDINIIKYNTNTQDVFGETLFLKNSFGIPAAAFAHTFSKPEAPSEANDNRGFYLNFAKIFVIGFAALASLVAVVLILRKKRSKN